LTPLYAVKLDPSSNHFRDIELFWLFDVSLTLTHRLAAAILARIRTYVPLVQLQNFSTLALTVPELLHFELGRAPQLLVGACLRASA